jgi:hypothetical protein
MRQMQGACLGMASVLLLASTLATASGPQLMGGRRTHNDGGYGRAAFDPHNYKTRFQMRDPMIRRPTWGRRKVPEARRGL